MEPVEIRQEASKIAKAFRKANKLTQTDLANLAGVSKRSILKVEHEEVVFDETLQKVLKACGWTYGVEVKRWLEADGE